MASEPQQARCPEDDLRALDECFIRLYDNIRRLAARLGWASTNPTLTSTALAHEVYLKLRRDPPDLAAKPHDETIAIFANAMRQILIDATRRKRAKKRTTEVLPKIADLPIEDALSVALAVEELSRQAPQRGRIVEARFLLGMTNFETGLALGVSERTVEREWKEAKESLTQKILGQKV
jgi:RNA polymerase sigma factor (TIGR02999 family)